MSKKSNDIIASLAIIAAVSGKADLTGANLRGANLTGANLRWADLRWATLSEAHLSGADLTGANLRWANLIGADLRGADLYGADLYGANLTGANLTGADLPDFQIPQEGSLIVFKMVKGGICKLRIPENAKRTASLIGRKCRAEFVEVLEAPKNNKGLYDSFVHYNVGSIVRPDSYDPDPAVECTHGIHFYLTREEAERN